MENKNPVDDANLLSGGVINPDGYCCSCGEKADLAGTPYQCLEMTPQGICSHLVCQQCYHNHEAQGQGTMERCDCHDSFENVQAGFASNNRPAATQRGIGGPQGSGGPLDMILQKMVSNEERMAGAMEMLAKPSTSDNYKGRTISKQPRPLSSPRAVRTPWETLTCGLKSLTGS